MSRAYCLTCNEQVAPTPSGTCPLGHPVAAHDHGPEPWVGFAGDGRSVVHAGHRTTGAAAAAEGVSHAGANGHGPTGDGGADEHTGDDLAALLAEALGGATDTPTAPPADQPSAHAATTESAPDADRDDLAALAAELQMDPAEPAFDEAAIDSADIDALLAELTGGIADPADAPVAPPATTPEPPQAHEEPVTPPPPPPPPTDTALFGDVPPPPEDVPSAPPATEAVDPWDEPAPEASAPPTPAAPVDLTNFTARGKRVSDGSPARPKKKRGWKR